MHSKIRNNQSTPTILSKQLTMELGANLFYCTATDRQTHKIKTQ